MVAYSFKGRFGPLIAAGDKRQTVRAERKRHARPGEKVQLYTGMRTRSCRLLGVGTCLAVSPIRFLFADKGFADGIELHGCVAPDPGSLDHFARSDGFESWAALRRFWAAEHDGLSAFSGVLIQWRPDWLEGS